MGKEVFVVLVAFVFSFLVHLQVEGCGLATHLEMIERGKFFFKSPNTTKVDYAEIIRKYPAHFQVGNAFPDWGYINLGPLGYFGNSADFAHWKNYIVYFCNYIHDNYKQPWTEEAEKLIAFVFGLSAHASADCIWHGRGKNRKYGFIPVQGMMDFRVQNTNSSCYMDPLKCWGTSHDDADDGGDVVLSYSYGLPEMDLEWELHMDAVMAVYDVCEKLFPSFFYREDDNGKIVKEVVTRSGVELRMAVQAAQLLVMRGLDSEINAGKLLYHKYPNPFLTERLEDWIGSGLDDSGIMASWVWAFLPSYIENGVNTSTSHHPANSFPKRESPSSSSSSSSFPSSEFHIPHSKLGGVSANKVATNHIEKSETWEIKHPRRRGMQDGVTVTMTKNGAFTKFSFAKKETKQKMKLIDDLTIDNQPMEVEDFVERARPAEKENTKRAKVSNSLPSFRTSISTAYSHFGTSLGVGDVNGDGQDDLVVGAPGFSVPGKPFIGQVFVKFGPINALEVPSDFEKEADLRLQTPDSEGVYTRFGQSIALLDLDQDGKLDLVISAPAIGSQGSVQGKNFVPLDGTGEFFNVYDGRFKGKVYVFFGSSLRKQINQVIGKDGKMSQKVLEKADLIIEAEQDFTVCGWNLNVGDVDGDQFPDLLIGSPFSANDDNSSSTQIGSLLRGKVSIFLSKKNFYPAGQQKSLNLSAADWTMEGEVDGEWFGYHMTTALLKDGKRLLLVGAPTRGRPIQRNGTEGVLNSVGKLYAFELVSRSPIKLNRLFTLLGDQQWAKSGQMFAVGSPYPNSSSTYLALSSPTTNFGDSLQPGVVQFFPLEGLQGDYNVSDMKVELNLVGSVHRARFGWKTGFTDLNKDGVVDFFATEPLRDANFLSHSQEAGGLYVWYGGKSFPTGTLQPANKKADQKIENNVTRQQLGLEVNCVGDLNGDGKVDVVLSTRDSALKESGRFSGSVYVYFS